MQIVVNNQSVKFKDGVIITDNLNDTLDSAVVVIENSNKLNYYPFDDVDIDNRRYVISNISETIASYQPRTYNYTIQLTSPLIKLERITLPDLSIKQVYKATKEESFMILENGYYSRTVAYYINQYVREYSDFGISQHLLDLANKVVCPEMAFNQPNLRELLMELLSTLDYLLNVTYNKSVGKYYIDFIDANAKGNAIDINKLDTDTTNYDINYYASNLDSQLKNAIPNQPVKSFKYLNPRTDDAILTTDNASLILDEPIYDIVKVELNGGIFEFYGTDLKELPKLSWIDITDHIVEKEVYDSLKVRDSNFSYLDLYKITTLYFQRGDNKIQGLGKTEKLLGQFDSGAALNNILLGKLPNLGVPMTSGNMSEISNKIKKNLLDMLFRITYLPQQEIRFITEKTKKQKHSSTLFNKQENSYVNVELFGNNSLDTLNRIGNPERKITAVYSNIDECPKLSDHLEPYILTNRTISVYDNYVVFEGNLTKDFSYKYQYNALNREKRYFKISDDSLVRNEVLKRYFIFDTINNTSKSNMIHANNVLKFIYNPCKYATVQAEYLDNTSSYLILTEIGTYKAGNSILMSLGFDNNVYAGNSKGDKNTGGYYQTPVKYTDEFGENIGVRIDVYEDMIDKVFLTTDEYIEYSENVISKLPRIDDSFEFFVATPKFSITSNKHKDQSETQKWTIQNIFLSNKDNIIIGDEFYNVNGFIYDGIGLDNIDIISYTDRFKEYVKLDTSKVTTLSKANEKDYLLVESNSITFNVSGNIGLMHNNKLVLGINNYNAGQKIYLNISDTRY